MTRLHSEHGQTVVLSIVFLTSLLGMAVLVADFGSWLVDRRQLQSAVDASALAAAQDLPDAGTAGQAASDYAAKNGLASQVVTLSSQEFANDTVDVSATRVSQGFFSKIFGISSITASASASARANVLDGVYDALPFGIAGDDPDLVCGLSCFDRPTSVPVGQAGAPGNFDLISLDGATTPGDLADLIDSGYGDLMTIGDYPGVPGAKFDSSQIQDAMRGRIGDTIVLPVYDSVTGDGANATYHVIGWVGFTITGFDLRGSSGELYGSLERLVQSRGEQSQQTVQPPYSAISVSLTK